jgi:hypothetical protein
VKWFGEPWPSDHHRAEVCRFDEERIEIPMDGETCPTCMYDFGPYDRGVQVPVLGSTNGTERADYHLKCFLEEVLGPELANQVIEEMERTA